MDTIWRYGAILAAAKCLQITGREYNSTFEVFQGSIKHIEVIVLVEDQAAVAHYYQEAIMKPTGLPAVPNYRTRVTQVFVKEDGAWKIRAAHWSPLMSGAGTSQTVIK